MIKNGQIVYSIKQGFCFDNITPGDWSVPKKYYKVKLCYECPRYAITRLRVFISKIVALSKQGKSGS